MKKSQLKQLIREAIEEVKIEESEASEKAKKMNLTHAGFGKYKDKSGKVVAMSKDGKLVKVKGGEASKSKKNPTEKSSTKNLSVSQTTDNIYRTITKKLKGNIKREDENTIVIRDNDNKHAYYEREEAAINNAHRLDDYFRKLKYKVKQYDITPKTAESSYITPDGTLIRVSNQSHGSKEILAIYTDEE